LWKPKEPLETKLSCGRREMTICFFLVCLKTDKKPARLKSLFTYCLILISSGHMGFSDLLLSPRTA
jgi:hypothetical protein